MFRYPLVVGSLALGLSVLQPARADILYDNLGNAPGTVLGTFPIGPPPPGAGPEGDSFSTGASAFLLTDVSLKLQGVPDFASFSVVLMSDSATACPTPLVTAGTCSGGPLAPLYTIASVNDNSLSTALADYDFSLASPQTLAPDTRYWIIASSANASGTLWSYTQDLSGVGVAGEFNDDFIGGPVNVAPNSDSPADTGCFGAGVTGGTADFCTPFQMQVAGQTLPEPDGLGVVGLAGLAGLLWRRQRSRNNTAS